MRCERLDLVDTQMRFKAETTSCMFDLVFGSWAHHFSRSRHTRSSDVGELYRSRFGLFPSATTSITCRSVKPENGIFPVNICERFQIFETTFGTTWKARDKYNFQRTSDTHHEQGVWRYRTLLHLPQTLPLQNYTRRLAYLISGLCYPSLRVPGLNIWAFQEGE